MKKGVFVRLWRSERSHLKAHDRYEIDGRPLRSPVRGRIKIEGVAGDMDMESWLARWL